MKLFYYAEALKNISSAFIEDKEEKSVIIKKLIASLEKELDTFDFVVGDMEAIYWLSLILENCKKVKNFKDLEHKDAFTAKVFGKIVELLG